MSGTASQPEKQVPVAIAGARGYAGLELARLLLRHPRAKLAGLFATGAFQLRDYLPEPGARDLAGRPTEELLSAIESESIEAVFLATPAEASIELAPKLLEAGAHVIDLSGAFRLRADSTEESIALYRRWYGISHTAAHCLARAEYGLVPWANETGACGGDPRLIANPGCFATATLLAVLPLLKAKLIDPDSIVVDAKSGTTGAGKKAEERLLHGEVDGLCLPYRIGGHQHEPEISLWAERMTSTALEAFFTTHLLNVRRGLLASVYARLCDGPEDDHEAAVAEAYSAAYGHYPLLEAESLDRGGERLLNLRRVVGSARTQIAYRVVKDRLYVFSLIDNLLKGAASQAVENFNRLLNEPIWLGLTETEGVL